MKKIFYISLTVIASSMLIVACSSKNDFDEAYEERPVSELYNEAMDFLKEKKYEKAVSAFDEVERQHPYDKWATKAQLMAAYSYYENKKYDDAIVSLDRFIQLHPGNKDAPYAYYLKSLCYYEQISGIKRDQEMTRLAMESLQELVTRFPASEYARDARLKIDLTVDHLAGKEMDIGRYYLKRKQYLPAINRFKTVVMKYQTTTHVQEALYRLIEAYTAFGLVNEANRTGAVLGYNFPGSEWYQFGYNLIETGQSEVKKEKERTWLGMKF